MIKMICTVLLVSCLTILLWLGWDALKPKSEMISKNFFQRRNLFLSAADDAGAMLSSYVIQAPGPNGEELPIDIAWIGSDAPRHVLLHISGTHGVEGFAGSIIQEAVLRSRPKAPQGAAIVFIHALNPYGMAHLRRVNESNADLNRNFHLKPQGFTGTSPAYHLIEKFLNPSGPTRRVNLFYPEIIWLVVRHGFTTLKQAIAGGQYQYPKGIYYGGSHMEESLLFLADFVADKFSKAARLDVIEVHTGLGPYGTDVLFWPLPKSHKRTKGLESALGEELASDAPEEGVGFVTPGDLQNGVPALLPNTEVNWVLQEYGAFGPIRTLQALRDENSYYQNGGRSLTHWSKRNLKNTFAPPYKDWEEMVLSRGITLFKKFHLLLNELAPRDAAAGMD